MSSSARQGSSVTETQLLYDASFEHKHCSPGKYLIAQENLILLFESGSKMHGTSLGGEDRDLYGICIEPPEEMLGVRRTFAQYHCRTVPDGQRSGEGDTDLNVYGLNKWVSQVCEGNFNHLAALYVPQPNVVQSHWAAVELRSRADYFVARSHARAILGYLEHQRRDILGNQRPELIERHGYDTKAAYHALRIAMQGYQLMVLGYIVMPMFGTERGYLLAVRKGLISLRTVMAKLGKAEAELTRVAKETTKLPAEIDYERINAWLPGFYRRFWEHQGHRRVVPVFAGEEGRG